MLARQLIPPLCRLLDKRLHPRHQPRPQRHGSTPFWLPQRHRDRQHRYRLHPHHCCRPPRLQYGQVSLYQQPVPRQYSLQRLLHQHLRMLLRPALSPLALYHARQPTRFLTFNSWWLALRQRGMQLHHLPPPLRNDCLVRRPGPGSPIAHTSMSRPPRSGLRSTGDGGHGTCARLAGYQTPTWTTRSTGYLGRRKVRVSRTDPVQMSLTSAVFLCPYTSSNIEPIPPTDIGV
jgi:hypothetical protein